MPAKTLTIDKDFVAQVDLLTRSINELELKLNTDPSIKKDSEDQNSIVTGLEQLLMSIRKAAAAKKITSNDVLTLQLVVTRTTELLNKTMTAEAYKEFAGSIQNGKSSTALKIIGGIMLGLCIAAIAAGIVLLAAPAVAAALGLGATGLIIASSVSAGTAAGTGIGSGVCFFTSRQKGVSKAACELQMKDAGLKVGKSSLNDDLVVDESANLLDEDAHHIGARKDADNGYVRVDPASNPGTGPLDAAAPAPAPEFGFGPRV